MADRSETALRGLLSKTLKPEHLATAEDWYDGKDCAMRSFYKAKGWLGTDHQAWWGLTLEARSALGLCARGDPERVRLQALLDFARGIQEAAEALGEFDKATRTVKAAGFETHHLTALLKEVDPAPVPEAAP